MRNINLILFIVACSFLAGCGEIPYQVAQAAFEPSATYIQAPSDATATPTPFQPLPPTPIILPTDTPFPTLTPQPPTLTPTPTFGIPDFSGEFQIEPMKGQINILLLGADARPGWSRFRTDTIILATLNSELGTMNLTSFPRDMYVSIPGYGQNRINTAYFFGGYKLLAETFKQNFGVKPDYFALINFSSFKRFIDEMGGLEVNVGDRLQDYRNGRFVTIDPGWQHMDADTVLWYVRSRKTTSDFGRNRRQQEVLQAIIDELLTLENITKVKDYYDLYSGMVTTDMELGDIIPLLPLGVKLTDTSRINHYYVGPKVLTSWITPEGAMVLLPNPDGIRRIMRKALNTP
jgi:LCP family protein required for cell wall assembly